MTERSQSRRTWLRGACATAAAAVLPACGTDESARGGASRDPDAGGAPEGGGASPEGGLGWTRDEILQFVQHRVDLQNAHDLDGLLSLYAPNAEVNLDDRVIREPETLRSTYEQLGLSSAGLGLSGTKFTLEQTYFTSDAILVSGRFWGRHTGTVDGFPPTNNRVAVTYCAFVRFDAAGKIASEEGVLNYGLLAIPDEVTGDPP